MSKGFNKNENQELKAYLVDLSCNCNCYEGTEKECHNELLNLVNNYGHEKNRYTIRLNRFD